MSGLKFDSNKAPFDLIAPLALAYLSQVLAFGAVKYAAHDWKGGIPLSKLIAASSRHLEAIKAGIDTDHETGLPHAAHLMCEAMFMVDQMASIHHCFFDDRYKETESKKDLLAALLAGDTKQIQEQTLLIHTLQSTVNKDDIK